MIVLPTITEEKVFNITRPDGEVMTFKSRECAEAAADTINQFTQAALDEERKRGALKANPAVNLDDPALIYATERYKFAVTVSGVRTPGPHALFLFEGQAEDFLKHQHDGGTLTLDYPHGSSSRRIPPMK